MPPNSGGRALGTCIRSGMFCCANVTYSRPSARRHGEWAFKIPRHFLRRRWTGWSVISLTARLHFFAHTPVVFSVASRWHVSSLSSTNAGYTMGNYPKKESCRKRSCCIRNLQNRLVAWRGGKEQRLDARRHHRQASCDLMCSGIRYI